MKVRIYVIVMTIVFIMVSMPLHAANKDAASFDGEKSFELDLSGLTPAYPKFFGGAKWGMTVEDVEKAIGEKFIFVRSFTRNYEEIEYSSYGEFYYYKLATPVYKSFVEIDGKNELLNVADIEYVFKKYKTKKKLVEIHIAFTHMRLHGTVGMIRDAIIHDLISKYDVQMTRTKDGVFSMYMKGDDTLIKYAEFPRDRLDPSSMETNTYIVYKYLQYKNLF